jgi:hypothetical protein
VVKLVKRTPSARAKNPQYGLTLPAEIGARFAPGKEYWFEVALTDEGILFKPWVRPPEPEPEPVPPEPPVPEWLERFGL